MTLEEIDGVDDFVAKLERIELPNQTIALLRDPLLRNYLMLSDRAVAIERAELWLASFLSEETEQIESGVGPSPTLEHILKYALAHAQHTKVGMVRYGSRAKPNNLRLFYGLLKRS